MKYRDGGRHDCCCRSPSGDQDRRCNTTAQVKRLAEAPQRTPQWLTREAITEYVEREEKREALRQDTLNGLQAFRETGQHVTADDADA